LKDPQVGAALEAFVTVRYEQGNVAADAAIKRFGVQAYPTLLVLSAKGEELTELGLFGPAEFIKDLERARGGTGTLPELRARLAKNPEDTTLAIKLAEQLSNRYPAEALEIAKAALARMDVEDRELYAHGLFLLGYAEAGRRNNDAALAHYERILDEYASTETCGEVAVFALNILSLVDPERALAFIAKALPLTDKEHRSNLEYARGQLYLKAAEAAWLVRGKEALEDGDAEWINMVAYECYLRNWHTRLSIQWARKAVELSKGAPHILDTLAHLLSRDGQIAEAVKVQSAALEKATDPKLRKEIQRGLVTFRALLALEPERGASGAGADENK
jgi:hypothetical protein